MDIERNVIRKFNERLGSDLKNLRGVYDFQEYLQVEKDEIEKSVGVYLRSSVYNAKRYCVYFIV